MTAELAETLASRMPGGARCSKTTSLHAASAKSIPARSSAVITPASTASGDRDGLPGARVRHRIPTCHAQVRVVALVSRAIAVDDPCVQTAVAHPSRFIGHGVPWRPPFRGLAAASALRTTRVSVARLIEPPHERGPACCAVCGVCVVCVCVVCVLCGVCFMCGV